MKTTTLRLILRFAEKFFATLGVCAALYLALHVGQRQGWLPFHPVKKERAK